MGIYDVLVIEEEIEKIAEMNEGEIPEEKLQELVEAQTKSIASIEKMCKYIRHLELFLDTCKTEENRIASLRQSADNRVKSIKKYLLPYVEKRGKFDAGTFKIGTRKSESVLLEEGFFDVNYGEIVQTFKPNKKEIKEAIKKGIKIKGASLLKKLNLSIK